MPIEDIYRSVRSNVRKLSHRDSFEVIWNYSQFLQLNNFQISRSIEVSNQFLDARPRQSILAEWTLEQITREVIRYAEEQARNGQTLRRWQVLANIANGLRDLEGEIYKILPGDNRIRLELMRIAHRQFVWQQQRFGWRWIIRYYKLFDTPAIREHAEQATGLTIDQIYLIGMAYLGMFITHPRAAKQLNVELPGITQVHIDNFLAFTSRTRTALSNRLRDEHALDESFAYRYSSLREFPLIEISYRGNDEIACPIPTLLFWRITTGLYYTLKGQRGFPTAFGKSFQRYVGEVLNLRVTNEAMTIFSEEEYHVGNNRKDTIDWIIKEGNDSALFVECKTMRLTWASKAGFSDLSALDQDIRKLAGAVIQVYKAIRDYRAGHYPQLNFIEARRIYPAIVTLEDWYFFGFELPAKLDVAVRTAMQAAGLPINWLEEMPYSVMSLHEFEKVSGVINISGIHPFLSGKLFDAELKQWDFRAYCNNHYREVVAQLPALFKAEFDAMFADLRA